MIVMLRVLCSACEGCVCVCVCVVDPTPNLPLRVESLSEGGTAKPPLIQQERVAGQQQLKIQLGIGVPILGAGLFWDSPSSHPIVLWGIVCCPVSTPGHLFFQGRDHGPAAELHRTPARANLTSHSSEEVADLGENAHCFSWKKKRIYLFLE